MRHPTIDMRTLTMLVLVVILNSLGGTPVAKLVLIVHYNWAMSLGLLKRCLEWKLSIQLYQRNIAVDEIVPRHFRCLHLDLVKACGIRLLTHPLPLEIIYSCIDDVDVLNAIAQTFMYKWGCARTGA